ncbi:MAG: hypothetical protein SGPRY_012009, partial [Prymnesium sp.]
AHRCACLLAPVTESAVSSVQLCECGAKRCVPADTIARSKDTLKKEDDDRAWRGLYSCNLSLSLRNSLADTKQLKKA